MPRTIVTYSKDPAGSGASRFDFKKVHSGRPPLISSEVYRGAGYDVREVVRRMLQINPTARVALAQRHFKDSTSTFPDSAVSGAEPEPLAGTRASGRQTTWWSFVDSSSCSSRIQWEPQRFSGDRRTQKWFDRQRQTETSKHEQTRHRRHCIPRLNTFSAARIAIVGSAAQLA